MGNNVREHILEMFHNYEKLDNGKKAAIRRAKSPEDMRNIGSFYTILPKDCHKNPRSGEISQYARVAYLFPIVSHSDDASPVGKILAKAGVRDNRINVISRSDTDNGPDNLKRALQQAVQKGYKSVNWGELGEILYYWGERSKQRILEAFYIGQDMDEEETSLDVDDAKSKSNSDKDTCDESEE